VADVTCTKRLRRPIAQHVYRRDTPGLAETHGQGRRDPDPESWERVVWTDYWEASHRVALTCLNLAIERHDDPALLRRAADRFNQLIAAHPQPPAYAYKNLGIAWARLIAVDPSAAARALEAWSIYLRIGPRDDKDRTAIETAVRQMNGGR